jgi:hypothetical protein
MPIHDWTRVDHGRFHDFHQAWANTLRRALNHGLLPRGYEAMVEQYADMGVPDVLTLELGRGGNGPPAGAPSGLVAVTAAPPKVKYAAEADADPYARLRKTVVVRRGDDRVVALIEIVSPGNKSSRNGIQAFTRKLVSAVEHGIHVLVLDLFPPGPRDPEGVHPLVWAEFADEPFALPPDKPLTFVSYSAGLVNRAYLEPAAVGDLLPEMPLFLEPDHYVNLPLEPAYAEALDFVPARTRDLLGG